MRYRLLALTLVVSGFSLSPQGAGAEAYQCPPGSRYAPNNSGQGYCLYENITLPSSGNPRAYCNYLSSGYIGFMWDLDRASSAQQGASSGQTGSGGAITPAASSSQSPNQQTGTPSQVKPWGRIGSVGAPVTTAPQGTASGGTKPGQQASQLPRAVEKMQQIGIGTLRKPQAQGAGQSQSQQPLTPVTGLKAAVTGRDQVTLTWNPVSGATEYFILRDDGRGGVIGGNGGFNDKTTKGTNFIDSALQPGNYRYVVLPADSRGEYTDGAPTVTVKIRPIIMLSIGDSVLWGQGLRTEDKYSTKVEKWIRTKNQMHRDVKHYVFAHAGAVIGNEGDPPSSSATFAVSGEFPASYPNLYYQKDVAVNRLLVDGFTLDNVDLVLVSGGANDMHFFTTILDPTMGPETIRDWVNNKKVKPRMTDFLGKVATTFPNARIVVTGYYRAITDATPIGWAAGAASIFFGPPGGQLCW